MTDTINDGGQSPAEVEQHSEPTRYEVIYEAPAPAPNSRSGGALYTVLEKLAADDNGQWAIIVQCASRSGANSILTAIKAGRRRVPEGRFEYTCRTDSKSNTSRLYAKYLGLEPVEEVALVPDADVSGEV